MRQPHWYVLESCCCVVVLTSGRPLQVLTPCCLKGWLGKQVQKRAAKQKQPHYNVLCDELGGMVTEGNGNTRVVFDQHMLSPKNGFILSHRCTENL